jgi:molecular chaperone Hsp33
MFPRLGVRGAWLRLRGSLADMPGFSQLAVAARAPLAEAVVAAGLLQGNLKADTRLRLQLQGDSRLRLLYAECTGDGALRGLLRLADGVAEVPRLADLDPASVLAITLEPAQGQRYQALVPLVGDRLDEALGYYFQQSEQLPTRLLLAGDASGGVGLMLQRMPSGGGAEVEIDEDGWNRIGVLLDTVKDSEMLQTEGELLLHRLFHDEQLELGTGKSLRFACSCSRQRVSQMFQALGHAESLAALRDDGLAEVDCEFCGQRYHFDRVDLEALFHEAVVAGSGQRH